jgi:arylsulfatase A-like enzyme
LIASPRPNIVFIVADDLGYADLGCCGGRAPVSPVLDSLAAGGMKFTQGYANSPVCSPTRFALMTARYQYRLRGAAEEPINNKSRGSTTLGLPPASPTTGRWWAARWTSPGAVYPRAVDNTLAGGDQKRRPQ